MLQKIIHCPVSKIPAKAKELKIRKAAPDSFKKPNRPIIHIPSCKDKKSVDFFSSMLVIMVGLGNAFYSGIFAG